RSGRAVRNERPRVDEGAECIRALELVAPEALGEVTVGRSVRELCGDGDAELGEAWYVFEREALRVLDPLPQSRRLPDVARALECVERFAVRAVADRVHADRPARGRAFQHDLGEVS